MLIQILLIVLGAYFLIINGILGVGLNWGRSKRYSEKIGSGITRIIYAVAGAALLAYGIITLINPGILPK